jgi:hypothetical protein
LLFTHSQVDVKAAGGGCLNDTKLLVSSTLLILNNVEKVCFICYFLLRNTLQKCRNCKKFTDTLAQSKAGDEKAEKVVVEARNKAKRALASIATFAERVGDERWLDSAAAWSSSPSSSSAAGGGGSVLLSPRNDGGSKAAKAQRDHIMNIKRQQDAQRTKQAMLSDVVPLVDNIASPATPSEAQEAQVCLSPCVCMRVSVFVSALTNDV